LSTKEKLGKKNHVEIRPLAAFGTVINDANCLC